MVSPLLCCPELMYILFTSMLLGAENRTDQGTTRTLACWAPLQTFRKMVLERVLQGPRQEVISNCQDRAKGSRRASVCPGFWPDGLHTAHLWTPTTHPSTACNKFSLTKNTDKHRSRTSDIKISISSLTAQSKAYSLSTGQTALALGRVNLPILWFKIN